jgi:predicted transglutaminase-like cysteine proteinase
MVALLPLGGAQATLPIALFKTAEIRAESHSGLRQWQAVLERIRSERPVYDACSNDPKACPSRAVMAWQSLLHQLRDAPLDEKVTRVNRFVNQWRYRTDQAVYGKSDYWASPLEFLANSGDCEDYAITKYVSLRLLGVPDQQMRLAVVQDTIRNLAHAVLVVYMDDTAVVLDNLTNAVLPHDRVANYTPYYYSVNETTRWAHVPSSRIMMSAAGRADAGRDSRRASITDLSR